MFVVRFSFKITAYKNPNLSLFSIIFNYITLLFFTYFELLFPIIYQPKYYVHTIPINLLFHALSYFSFKLSVLHFPFKITVRIINRNFLQSFPENYILALFM